MGLGELFGYLRVRATFDDPPTDWEVMAYGSTLLEAGEIRRGWRRAAAFGMLAAIATFFAAHWLWQPSYRGALVQARLDYYAGEPATPLELDAVRAQLTSALAVQEALRVSGQSGDSANVAAWQAQLSVHRDYQNRDGDVTTVLVQLPARDEAQGVAVVQSLAQQFLVDTLQSGGVATSAMKELSAARENASTALAKEDAARRELDAATSAHLELLRSSERRAAAPSAPSKVERVENPSYVERAEKLAALDRKRDELLLNLTPAHPLVKDVDSELEELQSRLSRTPRYLDRPEVDEPPQPELDHAADPAVAASQQRVNAAQDAYATARAARLEAQAAVEVLERSTAEAPSKQPRFVLAQSAQAIERYPSVSPIVRYLVLLAMSTVVLVLTTLVARPRQTISTLKSTSDIASVLRLPVVAHLKMSGGRTA